MDFGKVMVGHSNLTPPFAYLWVYDIPFVYVAAIRAQNKARVMCTPLLMASKTRDDPHCAGRCSWLQMFGVSAIRLKTSSGKSLG